MGVGNWVRLGWVGWDWDWDWDWIGMGWDGMGWDGMGWDGMSMPGPGPGLTRRSAAPSAHQCHANARTRAGPRRRSRPPQTAEGRGTNQGQSRRRPRPRQSIQLTSTNRWICSSAMSSLVPLLGTPATKYRDAYLRYTYLCSPFSMMLHILGARGRMSAAMSRRIRRLSLSVYDVKNSASRILPCRDMSTMKSHPIEAARACRSPYLWSAMVGVPLVGLLPGGRGVGCWYQRYNIL